MIVTLSLVYNIQCFSGVIFQFVAEPVHRKKKAAMDVLAAGGRYDKLVGTASSGWDPKVYMADVPRVRLRVTSH